ncbi:unnamed protein product [Brassicogethes aeneus]|nr:unnamed protein product [Brassicogethes aeneus]
MEKLQEDVISMIRSCLISNKSEMTLKHLENDYRTLCGERIPYTKFGFKRLEDFISSVPTLYLRTAGNETYVKAQLSEKSQHIQSMVNKQKSSKKSSLQKIRFSNAVYRQPTQPNRWRPKEVNVKWKSKFQNSPRLAAVSHNQFVNRPVNRQPPQQQYQQGYQHQNYHQSAARQDLSQRLHLPPADKKLTSTTSSNNGNAAPPVVTNHVHAISTSGQNGATGVQGNVATLRYKRTTSVPLDSEPSNPCNSLINAKKRITRKMSEITLDRDSGNSSPTSDTQPKSPSPELPTFVRTGNSSADLKKFAETFGLGEVEISSNQVAAKKKAERFFTCKVKVGKNTYYSYPEDFRDPIEAEKYCSNKALDDLIPKHSRRKSLLTANHLDILERVPPMLEKHQHGIWAWQLEMDYADKYNEALPADWLKIIDTSQCIQVEKGLESHVLRHCKPGDVLQKGQKWSTTPMKMSDVSVPSNTVQFNDDARLSAQVTYVVSASEVWCRQCDNVEFQAYNEMSIRMEKFYNAHAQSHKVTEVDAGRYYVANFDGGWYRVRAVNVDSSDVTCFFIDYGDETLLQKDNLYQLKREFATCQAQAFVCRLAGLEELYEASANSEKLMSIMSKQVLLELASDSIDENLDELSFPVFMYDADTGNSLNQDLIPLLTIESASPVITKGSITEVYITNIESNGDVYFHLHSRGYESLQELLLNLETQILQNPPNNLIEPITKTNSENKLYFAQYKVDGHWYRVQIIDWAPQGNFAQIYFVDYGNTDVINVNSEVLYPLDKLSDVLSQYPFQAVKVKMALDAIPTDFIDMATKLMPADVPVLLKIIKYDEESCPLVEFFKRSPEDILYCVNNSIGMEAELKKGDGNNNKSPKRKIISFSDELSKNVPSGGTLDRPDLPSKDSYFEVRISFAVNPWNFFVQPLKSQEKLNTLMENLQKRYQNVQYSPLQTEDITPGQIFASKHEDGCWYRTSVIKVIHKGSISVFYCDFGYYSNLTVQQLIPLDPEFLELPYQALKAKLTDIKPKQNKWTMEDCEFFKQRVEKKNFYSILRDIEKDELYESDIVLKLILIDTSDVDDVYIGKELISRKIAVEC